MGKTRGLQTSLLFTDNFAPVPSNLPTINSPVPILARRKVNVNWTTHTLRSVTTGQTLDVFDTARCNTVTAGYHSELHKLLPGNRISNVPHPHCTCGFYAVTMDNDSAYNGCWATVELSGTVIECGEVRLDFEELERRIETWNVLHHHKPEMMINPEVMSSHFYGSEEAIRVMQDSLSPMLRRFADIVSTIDPKIEVLGYRAQAQRILTVDLGNDINEQIMPQSRDMVQKLAENYPGVDFYVHALMPKPINRIYVEEITDINEVMELEDVRITYRAGQPPSYRRNEQHP